MLTFTNAIQFQYIDIVQLTRRNQSNYNIVTLVFVKHIYFSGLNTRGRAHANAASVPFSSIRSRCNKIKVSKLQVYYISLTSLPISVFIYEMKVRNTYIYGM